MHLDVARTDTTSQSCSDALLTLDLVGQATRSLRSATQETARGSALGTPRQPRCGRTARPPAQSTQKSPQTTSTATVAVLAWSANAPLTVSRLPATTVATTDTVCGCGAPPSRIRMPANPMTMAHPRARVALDWPGSSSG